MKKMKRKKNFFFRHVRLTEYPTGDFKTPGFNGAARQHSIFEPYYKDDEVEKLLNYQKKIDNDSKPVENHVHKVLETPQEGFGEVPEKEVANAEVRAQLDEDIYEKMQKPIFKVTKVKQNQETAEDNRSFASTSVAGPSSSNPRPTKKFKASNPSPPPKPVLKRTGQGEKHPKKEKKYAVF